MHVVEGLACRTCSGDVLQYKVGLKSMIQDLLYSIMFSLREALHCPAALG